MARPPAPLTPIELEIMKVLWDSGALSVLEVQKAMPGTPAYTTVQTMLNVLLRKGKVRRTLKDRAYIYRPAWSRAEAAKIALRDLIDRMFSGSAEKLVMGLVEAKELTPEKLRKLEAKLRGDKP
jgi:BlaI family penicillinase repressor